jgi:hypothetical protein
MPHTINGHMMRRKEFTLVHWMFLVWPHRNEDRPSFGAKIGCEINLHSVLAECLRSPESHPLVEHATVRIRFQNKRWPRCRTNSRCILGSQKNTVCAMSKSLCDPSSMTTFKGGALDLFICVLHTAFTSCRSEAPMIWRRFDSRSSLYLGLLIAPSASTKPNKRRVHCLSWRWHMFVQHNTEDPVVNPYSDFSTACSCNITINFDAVRFCVRQKIRIRLKTSLQAVYKRKSQGLKKSVTSLACEHRPPW